MKQICFSLFVFFGTVCAHAQNYLKPAIVTTDTLVKGIYMNFEEFQNNNPSVRVDFRTIEPGIPLNSIYNNMPVSRLMINDGHNDFTEFTLKHWGICDGKNAFINFKGKYQKIALDGKFSQYTASNSTWNSDNPAYNVNYILDITNNDKIEVTVQNVEEILKKENAGLYLKFKKDRNGRMMMYTYINQLNEILNNQ